jgi:hypothetical protein
MEERFGASRWCSLITAGEAGSTFMGHGQELQAKACKPAANAFDFEHIQQ